MRAVRLVSLVVDFGLVRLTFAHCRASS